MNRFSAVLKTIARGQTFLITTHHNPDADALSSAIAVAIFLKSRGKKVYIVNEDPVPAWLDFLPKTALWKKAEDCKAIDYDAAIILDCGDIKRIGGVERLLLKVRPSINIDHHVTNPKFATVNVVDAKASSTCELVFDLLKEAKFKLNKDLAMLLYAGIMTDTGSFRYDNTTPKTHAVAAELMTYKISATWMYDRLYVGIPVADIKHFTEIIHDAELLCNNKVYCVSLSGKTVEDFSKKFDIKEKLFGFLRSVDGIEVIVILTELNSKEVRANFRSQGEFNVALLAQQFDGGGHVKAAGCKIYDSLPKAKAQILSAIKKFL